VLVSAPSVSYGWPPKWMAHPVRNDDVDLMLDA
jgi:hypothetical protein